MNKGSALTVTKINFSRFSHTNALGKERKVKIRKKGPYLTRNIIWESHKKLKKYYTQESQEVSPFPADDHNAARNRQDSITKIKMKHK